MTFSSDAAAAYVAGVPPDKLALRALWGRVDGLSASINAGAIFALINLGGTGDAIAAELPEHLTGLDITVVPNGRLMIYTPITANTAANPTITITAPGASSELLQIRSSDGSDWPAGGFIPPRAYILHRLDGYLRVVNDLDKADIEGALAPLSVLSEIVGQIDVIGPATIINGALGLVADNTYAFDQTVAADGTLRSIRVSIVAAGNFTLYGLTRVGSSFTSLWSKTLTATVSGVQRFSVGVPVAAGSLIGIRGRGIVGYNDTPGVPFWTVSPSTLRDSDGVVNTVSAIQAQYEIVRDDSDALISQVAALTATTATVQPRVAGIEAALGTDAGTVIGPAEVIAGDSGFSADNTYSFDIPVDADGRLDTLRASVVAAGNFTLYEMTKSGSNFTVLQSRVIAASSVGVQDFAVGWDVRAGSYLGLRGRNVLGYTAGGGMPFWTVVPSTLRDSDGATDNSVQIQARFQISRTVPGTVLGRLEELEGGGRQVEPLSVWRLARAKALIGSRPAIILCGDDSNTTGWANTASGGNSRELSYPSFLARELNAGAVPARADAIAGRAIINNNTSQYRSYDPRVTFGGGWGVGGPVSLGGEMFSCSTAGGVLTFAPTASWDRADVWVAPLVATTIELEAAGTVQSFAVTPGQIARLSLGLSTTTTGPLLIRNVSGTSNVLIANVWTSAAPGICVINAGRAGWNAVNAADASEFYSPVRAIASVAPDLILVEVGLNDADDGVPLATYETHLRSKIEAGLAAGADVAIVISFPANRANWGGYVAVQRALAAEYGLVLFDHTARLGTYAAALAGGFVASDAANGLHLSAPGLADKALMIAKRL